MSSAVKGGSKYEEKLQLCGKMKKLKKVNISVISWGFKKTCFSEEKTLIKRLGN